MILELTDWNSPFTYIFLLFALFLLIQLVYYWLIFGKFAFHKAKKQETNNSPKPVSVVIAARDEYANLQENLPLLLQQNYPDFEVVVVDDCSSDETPHLLKQFASKYPNLKVITVTENLNFFKGKKFPLALGIKSAKNDYLLFTDADCKPATQDWLMLMQQQFGENKHIVLGYGKYERRKGFLNMLIRFDTIYIALQYFSMSLLKLPYMGVGRNLAYRKGLFYKSNGFTSHYKVMSGDDDLFINQTADCKNTNIQYHSSSHTISKPKTKVSAWFFQKKRHLSTGPYYKFRHKLLLGLLSASRFLFYASFAALLFSNQFYLWALSGFTMRLVAQLIIMKKTMNKLEERNLLLISPILDFIFVFINTGLILSNFFFKANKWK